MPSRQRQSARIAAGVLGGEQRGGAVGEQLERLGRACARPPPPSRPPRAAPGSRALRPAAGPGSCPRRRPARPRRRTPAPPAPARCRRPARSPRSPAAASAVDERRAASTTSGAGTKPQPDRRDDPERSLRADQQRAQVVAGDVLAQRRRPRRISSPGATTASSPADPAAGHAVLERARAARVGGHVAADLRLLGRARVGREQQPATRAPGAPRCRWSRPASTSPRQ